LSWLSFINLSLLYPVAIPYSIIVTGASGFIGSHLFRHFLARCPVLRLSRVGVPDDPASFSYDEFLKPSLASSIASWNPRVLIHCAGIAHRPNPRSRTSLDSLYEANVLLPTRLAEAARLCGIQRFVFLSSIGVHGSYTQSGEAISENSAIKPSNAYAASKALAEDRLFAILGGSSCDLSVVRPTLVYGANAPGNLRKLQRAVDLGLPLPVAEADNSRSLLSVHNLVSAIDILAHNPKAANQIYVIADSELISTKHLVETIALHRFKRNPSVRIPRALMRIGRQLPVVGQPLSQLSLDCIVNSSKIRKDLLWSQPLDQASAMAEAFSPQPSSL